MKVEVINSRQHEDQSISPHSQKHQNLKRILPIKKTYV